MSACIPKDYHEVRRTYFTVLEQHNDGAWWYHPRWSFDNFDQAADYAVDFSARHENRPVTVIEHTGELPDRSCCTRKTSYGLAAFDFAGGILARINILNNFKI